MVQKVEPNMVSILRPHAQLLLRYARDNGGRKQADSMKLSARIGTSSFATARNAQQEIELRRQHVSHGGGPRRRNHFQLEKSVWKNGPNNGLGLGLFLACSGSTHAPLPAASGLLMIASGSMDVPLWAASGFLKIASGSTHAPLPAASGLLMIASGSMDVPL